MKKTLLSLILLACLGLSQRAAAQNEDRVHSATVVELGLHSRLAYHQALPLGLVASAHVGYELHTNPVGFLDKENSAPLEYTFPMLLPTAGIELRWYTGREKSQEEINSGLYVVAGGDVQTRTAGVVFNRLYRGPWRYRYGAKGRPRPGVRPRRCHLRQDRDRRTIQQSLPREPRQRVLRALRRHRDRHQAVDGWGRT